MCGFYRIQIDPSCVFLAVLTPPTPRTVGRVAVFLQDAANHDAQLGADGFLDGSVDGDVARWLFCLGRAARELHVVHVTRSVDEPLT
jgi:hypothetical protein